MKRHIEQATCRAAKRRGLLIRPTIIVGMMMGALLPAIPCHAQTVSGSFAADPGGSFSPTFVGAYMAYAESDPRTKELEIIFSMVPVDLANAVAALNPHLAVINEQRNNNRNHIVIRISNGSKVQVDVVWPKVLGEMFLHSESGTVIAELTANTGDRVAGHVFSPVGVERRDGMKVALDLTFSTPITIAPAGSSLPPGGGEPGEALSAFFAARERGDWPAIKAAFSRSAKRVFVPAAREDNQNRINTFGDLEYLFPSKAPTIRGGTQMGDTAVLEVESRMELRARFTLVRLVRVAAGWVFDEAAFIGMVP